MRRPPAEIRRITCPCCGLQSGYVTRIIGGPRGGRQNRWTFVRDPDKPFGIIYTSQGRGTLQVIGHFDPSDDPDGFYIHVKYHLLSAIAEWIVKRYVTADEVTAAVRGDVKSP